MVIDYLETSDYLVFITEAAFRKLLRDNNCKFIDAQSMAYGHIKEKLSARYRIADEIALKGEDRSPSMVRWMAILSVYYLYQSIPDDEIPERVRINYDDVIREIDRVAAGKDNCTMQPVLGQDGKAKTQFRWTSSPRRTHNPFG